MSKKGKNKEVSHLRAEVEFLRAQLKDTGFAPEKSHGRVDYASATIERTGLHQLQGNSQKTTVVYRVESEQLKKDLIKTFTLTAFSLIFLFVLYYAQPYLPALTGNLAKTLQSSPLKLKSGK